MAVKIVEVQHVVLGVGIVWNSRIKGNQCQIFWPFWVSFFWLPGQVGGGEHAQQSIERSSWTAVAWITDSRCSGVGEWHVKACSWKTAKLGLWVLEIKKLWLRVWFLLSRYGTWRGMLKLWRQLSYDNVGKGILALKWLSASTSASLVLTPISLMLPQITALRSSEDRKVQREICCRHCLVGVGLNLVLCP